MRTKKTFKNIVSVLLFNLIIGVLGFIKVRVFVHGLSDDIYSLNQLFYQVFSYLTIADIGFALILNQHLYKAFAKNDQKEINKIYNTSRKFFSIIGTIMIGIAIIISFFIQFLTKADVSILYMQIIFMIFIIRNVIDYYFIAPRYVLEADQKLYTMNHLVKGIKILETIIEIVLVLCKVNYLIILLPGIVLTFIVDIYINRKIFKMYPWLTKEEIFDKKYLVGTKNIIYQKIAGLLNSNTDIILISSFITPLSVIIYTSYSYITKYITDTIYIISTSITPSYANMINKEKEEKSYNVFLEINIMFLFLASFVCIMLYGFLNQLIVLWVGEKYLVSKTILFMFCFISFQLIAEKPINIVINSKGLFKETKTAIILESILNLTISLILVHYMGIAGVLIGTIVSKLLTTFVMQPRYLYKNIFNQKVYSYFLTYFIVVAINLVFIMGLNMLNIAAYSVSKWIIFVLIFSFVIGIILFIIYNILFKSFRLLVKRGLEFIKVKGKYTY